MFVARQMAWQSQEKPRAREIQNSSKRRVTPQLKWAASGQHFSFDDICQESNSQEQY